MIFLQIPVEPKPPAVLCGFFEKVNSLTFSELITCDVRFEFLNLELFL